MAFVKLDTGILTSTLWVERECREVFITALLMAHPYELTEPTPQICVRSLDLEGFIVPPGWYGFVPAAGIGIVRMALVEREPGLDALEKLGSPDTESRSKEFEGRRLVRVDGGYLVLNFIKYREKDATTADRSRRWRERQKLKEAAAVASRVSPLPSRVIRHQAEAEAEAEAGKSLERTSGDARTAQEGQHGRRQVAKAIPDDWRPSLDDRQHASDLGLDPDSTCEAFVDYWSGRNDARARRTDWSRTWRVWCGREARSPRPGGGPVRPARNGPVSEAEAFHRAGLRLERARALRDAE